jgi:hypothetical protein
MFCIEFATSADREAMPNPSRMMQELIQSKQYLDTTIVCNILPTSS